MKRRRNASKFAAIAMATILSTTWCGNIRASERTGTDESKSEYVVLNKNVQNSDYEETVETKYLTNSEATQLESQNENVIVEKNLKIKGSWDDNYVDPDKVSDDWNIKMINMKSEDVKEKSNKVKVALIDSGVDECEGIQVKERYNLVPSESGVNPVYDDITGHGTAIASIICGSKDTDRNSYGINENIDLYSIKIMDGDNTAPLDRVIEAIYKAIEYKVNIINMSFGTTQYSEALHKAIKDANEEGILIIAAAGNTGTEGGNVEYPAAFPEVMAVGAVNSNAELSDISADGKEIDVVAPGENVKTASSFGLETVSSGTSMAAPHVVGLASILWQEDMTKSSQYIKELIMDSAKKLEDNNTTYKLIDIDYAVGNYKQFDKNYGEKSDTIEKNVSKPIVCNEMAKVTARWSKNKHGLLVLNNANGKLSDEQVKMIRAGIRYNDEILSGSGNSNAGIEYDRRVWHSLTRRNNYMATINFVGRIIQSENCDTNIKYDSVLHFSEANMDRMKKDINAISKDKLLKIGLHGDKNSSEYKNLNFNIRMKRLLMFGMELHIITDTFAHRAYGLKPYLQGNDPKHWGKVTTNDEEGTSADDVNLYPSRYKCAGKVVKNVMNQCLKFDSSNMVKMKDTGLILSKQIVYNNTFATPGTLPSQNDLFLLYRLASYSEANKKYDVTYNNYENQLIQSSAEFDNLD